MKKLFFSVTVLFCLFSILTGMPAGAADRTVSVGVYENAPKVFTDESGRPAGIFIDVIEFIAQKEGWELQFVPGTWAEGLDRLERGEIDLMPDVAYNAERAERYSFHEVPVLSSWAQVYAGEDSGIRSIIDLEGKRVAVLEGSVQQDVFVRMEEEFDLNARIVAFPDYKTIFQKVRDNEADAAVTNRFYGVVHADEFGLEDTAVIFHPSDLFFASDKGKNRELLNTIDARLSELKKDKQSVYYKSLKRRLSEQPRFKLPGWVMMAGMILAAALVLSLLGGAVLKRQVQARTRELTRLNRTLRTLSDCNQALAHSADEAGLLESVCRILAEKGGYCMACVGLAEKDRPQMLSVAAHAFADRDPETWDTALWGDADPGRNFAVQVFQSRKMRSARNILTDSKFSQWRDDAFRRGYQSVLMLPLLHEDDSLGVLGVYSPDPDAFDTEERDLLSEIAGDLAFGITSHRTRHARDYAESADRLKSAFLATMSHELRTPLNSIIGFTGILLQGLAGPLNEEQEKQLHMVQNSSRHLLALINDVLDISKIESGQLTLSFSTFDVASVIAGTVRIVSPIAEKKDIKIHTDIAEDVSEATLDQRRLEQVILNLLNNAVKFTDKGRVEIGCRREEGAYVLSVSDTGIGIQPEELSGLFQPFHQIDTGLSRKKEGTGLGLSISKKLMDLMNGTIHVQSTWGKGSTFTIRFPKEPPQEENHD